MPNRDSSASRAKSPRVRTVKPRSFGGALAGLLGAIAMSVIAGVLLTAAITPVVALTGAGATSAIQIFENLPDHINPGALAQPSTLYAKKGGKTVQLATFYDQDRKTMPWDGISQYVKDAVVSEEDPRFYSHGGIDVISTGRAVLQNMAGTGFSGASTVSMQYVRNVLIQESQAISDEKERKAAYKDAMKQTADRKLKEMKLAISIEKKFSKDEILLGYLNIALFGRQVYGIESAARYFYGKSAKDVTLSEAASLVAIVNNPSQLQLDLPENIERNTERRNKILGQMLKFGKITEAQYDAAIATPVTPKITPRVPGCSVAEGSYGLGHFCDYVQRYIRNDPSFGATPEERMFKFRRGGYQIMTTIDLDLQRASLDTMHDNVPQEPVDGIDVGGASSSVQVNTGKVLAMAQSRPFNDDGDFLKKNPKYTSINWNTDFEYGGSGGFQVGSTFKPITLAQWLDAGNSVNDVVNVNGRTVQLQSFQASCMPEGVYSYGGWTFSNDNTSIRGQQSVKTTIGFSINGGVASMAQKLDLCAIFRTADKLNIHRASDLPKATQADVDAGLVLPEQLGKFRVPTLNGKPRDLSMVPSNTFGGVDEIAPITMASAYAAFAGGGKICTPVPIESITGPDGAAVPFTKSKCTNALSPEVAAGVAYTLQYTAESGLAREAASPDQGVPHLAKTGTTDDVVDNWTTGASSTVATSTWVGNVTGKRSTYGYGFQTADSRVWRATMREADLKYGGEAFPRPSESALRVTLQKVPDLTGKPYEEAARALTAAGFAVADGGTTDSSVAKGLVAKTDPAGGSSVTAGSVITIFRSSGSITKVPGGLVGQTGAAGQSALAGAGFTKVALQCDTGSGKPDPAKDRVSSVSPGSGKEAKRGSTITLTLNCRG